MLNSLSKVSYGYTKNGNRYEKSSKYKNGGEFMAKGYMMAQVLNKKSDLHCIVDAMLKPENLPKVGIDTATKIGKYLMNNKMARFALLGAGLIGGFYLVIGAGKLIGHCLDKIVDIHTKREADKKAQVEQ